MGPCTSKEYSDGRRRSTMYGRRNTLVVRPKINIDVGECVNKDAGSAETKIIFIFGGPGTGKGTIVNNLKQMYDTHLIIAEDHLRDSLYDIVLKPDQEEEGENKKLSINATKEITRYIAEHADDFSQSWLFDILGTEIEKAPKGSVILIDAVPNLKFLLRCSAFCKMQNDSDEFVKFEEKYPVLFAINLELTKENLKQNIQATHACTKAPSTKGGADPKAAAAAAAADVSDEIDMSRTERRFNQYTSSVEEFLTYFKNKGKLLSVDTSSFDIEAAWWAIRDYVVQTHIAVPLEGIEPVILVQMGDDDFADVDLQRYPMVILESGSLVGDEEKPTPENILKKLILSLRDHATTSKAFLLDCHGSELCDVEKLEKAFGQKQSLVFMEEEIGTLDFFFHGLRRKSTRKKSIARKNAQFYKTVTTGDNEALIFPVETDSEICRLIINGFISLKYH